MKRLARKLCSLGAALVVLAVAVGQPQLASADPVVKLKGEGTLHFSDDGRSEFFLVGQASHLGKFLCVGEVDFIPGEEEGSLIGIGVAVFEAANGDLLVGVVLWEIDATGDGHVSFPWRDCVIFSDGTTVESTGRFADSRPGEGNINISLSTFGDILGDFHFLVK